jgi:hypothetical protein
MFIFLYYLFLPFLSSTSPAYFLDHLHRLYVPRKAMVTSDYGLDCRFQRGKITACKTFEGFRERRFTLSGMFM